MSFLFFFLLHGEAFVTPPSALGMPPQKQYLQLSMRYAQLSELVECPEEIIEKTQWHWGRMRSLFFVAKFSDKLTIIYKQKVYPWQELPQVPVRLDFLERLLWQNEIFCQYEPIITLGELD